MPTTSSQSDGAAAIAHAPAASSIEPPRASIAQCVLYGGLLLAAYAIAWSGRTANSDLFMTLSGGRDVVQGKLATPDDWSYLTEAYAPDDRIWINQSWLTGWGLYRVWTIAGEGGLVAVRTVLIAAFALGILLWLSAQGVSWPAAIVGASCALVVCRYFLLLRGNLLTLVAIPWLLFLLDRSTRKSVHWFWPLAVWLAVWPHCHGGFVFGYGLVALWLGLHVMSVVSGRSGLTWRRWGLLAGVALAALALAVVVSPFGVDVIRQAVSMAGQSEWRTVREWQPLVQGWDVFWAEMGKNSTFIEIGYFVVMVALTAGLAGAAAIRLLLRRARWQATAGDAPASPIDDWPRLLFDIALVGGTVVMAFVSRRFASLAAISLALPLALCADQLWCRSLSHNARSRRRRVGSAAWWVGIPVTVLGMALGYVMLSLGFGKDHPLYGPESVFERQIVLSRQPVKAARFMRVNDITCNVFHQYEFEGFFHWSVPGVKVGCGGRAQQIYNGVELTRQTELLNNAIITPRAMELRQGWLDRRKIRIIVLDAEKSWPLMVALIKTAAWLPVFFDGQFCVLVQPIEGLERVQIALMDDQVAVVPPESDPEGSAAKAALSEGKLVFTSERTYLRTRALFMTTPRLTGNADGSDDARLQDYIYRVRMEQIQRAQAVAPSKYLFMVAEDMALRRPEPRPDLRDHYEAELARLDAIGDDEMIWGDRIECWIHVATFLSNRYRGAGQERKALNLDEEVFRRLIKRDRRAFWWTL
ncbi:MAG: hypothetical protein V3T70_01960 [Phycisphaerae bacterium]